MSKNSLKMWTALVKFTEDAVTLSCTSIGMSAKRIDGAVEPPVGTGTLRPLAHSSDL